MRNIKITLEYCGINYHGWARQLNHITIEEVLLDKLEKVLKEKPVLIASGRTDAGVHAKGQVVNYFTKSKIPNDGLKRVLNDMLPKDIQILKVDNASEEFHSRFSAVKKDYQYVIAKKYSVFEKGMVYNCPYKLDMDAMQSAASLFIGKHDFKKFSLVDKCRERIKTVRNLFELEIVDSKNKIYLNFSGEGFLRGMVRLIGGIIIEVGRGQIEIETVKKALRNNTIIKEKWPILPPDGLYLKKVYY